MRHAFLVIAHTEYDVLQTLIELLDNPCCDIYIHIDKKSKLPNILTEKTNRYTMGACELDKDRNVII